MSRTRVLPGKHGRRTFLRTAAAAAPLLWTGAPAILRAAAGKPTDVRIEQVTFGFEDFAYRTPIKFGGNVVDRVTLLNVTCRVKTRDGRSGAGTGSMPMGNVWAWPSKQLSYDQTLDAMKALATRVKTLMEGYGQTQHPVDIAWALESEYVKAADAVIKAGKLPEAMPKLCALVTASPFDAALNDAFGRVHGVSTYRTYGIDFMTHDLSRYLGKDFRGEYLDRYVQPTPKPRMPLYHLVGALDPIEDADVQKRIGDGLPETLPEWIRHNGLTHIKIKLNGSDLDWDVERVVRVDRVTAATQQPRGVAEWVYSLDFNEKAPNEQYLLDFLARVKQRSAAAYDRVQYVEQPTARDLRANPANVMHAAARLKPVVADESITDPDSLLLARERGYSGAALKACKGQSQALLIGAMAQKHQLFLCVQDLTCPGASLVHSASLSAHVPGVSGIEANARQYVPAANKGWEKTYPGLFTFTDGTVDTSILKGPGLSTPPPSA